MPRPTVRVLAVFAALFTLPASSFVLRGRLRASFPLTVTHETNIDASVSDASEPGSIERRSLLASSAGAWFWKVCAASATEVGDSPPPETVVLRGRVTLASDVVLDPSRYQGAALYVTCRPETPDNVPAAILNGTRGKAPPVLSSKIINPSFPLDLELSVPRDLTPEGASNGESDTFILDPNRVWWKETDLVVSARWDSDGSVATRSPDDLVARGRSKRGPDSIVSTTELELTGRGAFGKFATGAKNTAR